MDKPGGISSHGVVSVARRALGTRSVGHAGTLDPMATGLLVLGVGQGTKLLNYLVLDDKRYDAEIALGSTTDTLDAEGRVTGMQPVPEGLSVARVEAAARGFIGDFAQRVPDVSAVKRGGEPLYKKARRGEVVDAPQRVVTLHAVDVASVNGERARLSVHCGKGFYVRAFARDLAVQLGTVGHLTALRRTDSGHFGVDGAVGFDRLRLARDEPAVADEVRSAVTPLSQAVAFMPRLTVDDAGCEHLRHGRIAPADTIVAGDAGVGDAPVAFISGSGQLIAIGVRTDEGLRSRRGFPA